MGPHTPRLGSGERPAGTTETVMAVGVQDQHARRPNEPVDRERDEPGGQARLPVRADQFVGVPVGDHRRDRGNAEGRRDPDELVRH
jgi:hypothetical protein